MMLQRYLDGRPMAILRRWAAHKLVGGAFWSVLGGGFSSMASLFGGILVARLLGPTLYGGYGIVQSMLATFIVFIGPAAGLTATKFLAELRHREPQRAGEVLGLVTAISLVVSALLAIAMLASAGLFATDMYRNPGIAPALRIAAFAMFLNGVNSVQVGALAGLEAFKDLAVVNVIRAIGLVALAWIGTTRFGLEGATGSVAASSALAFIASEIALRRRLHALGIRPSTAKLGDHVALLWGFSFPAMLTSAIALLTMWLGGALLVRQPEGYREFGFFTAANQWRTILLFIPNLLVQPFLPRMSAAVGERRAAEFRRILNASLIATSLATVAMAFAAVLFSTRIMAAYGSVFTSARATLLVVIIATVLCAPSIAIIQALNALGRPWVVVLVHVLWTVAFLLTQQFGGVTGAFGLAVAYAVSYAVQLIAFGWIIRRRAYTAWEV